MKFPYALLPFAILALHTDVATAQALPEVPASLLDKAGVVCIRVSESGDVSGAFIIVSTGNSRADQDLLEWVHHLRWPAQKLDDTWFPMPVAIGGAKAPEAPVSCSPSFEGVKKRVPAR